MGERLEDRVKRRLDRRKRKRRWRSSVSAMSLVVILTTVLILALPGYAWVGDQQSTETSEVLEQVQTEATASETSTEEKMHEEETSAEDSSEEEYLQGDLTYDAKGDYHIKVAVDASDKIPQGASLKVSEITDSESDSDQYEGYYDSTKKKVEKQDGTYVSSARFFDITIQNQDGIEIEPAEDGNPVNVTVTFDDQLSVSNDAKVEVFHFKDDTDQVKEVIKTKTDGDAENISKVEFDTESFSTYGIVVTQNGEEVAATTGEKITITGAGADYKYHTWTSANTGLATVQWNKNSCVVTCKATGQVTITHKYGSKAGRQNSSETFIVTITDGEITELTKTFSDVTVKVNKIAGTNKLLNGKELVVEKLESGSDYDTYVDLLGDDTVLGIYDIYLKDTETGERSELPSGAKLKVTITADYLENGEEVNVGHYKNPTTPLGVTNDSDVAVDKVTVSVHSISFFITSFSTFTISSEGSGDSGGGGTVVPTQQGSILDGRTFDDANDWQIVSGKYTDNAPTNKTDSRDGNVRVQKNVIPTGTENEFYVYLSIDTKVTNEVITTFLKEKLTVSNYLFGSASHFPGGGSEHDGGKLYRGNSWNDLVQGTGKNAGDHRVTFRIYSPQPEHEYLGTVTLGCEDSNFQVYLKLSDNDNGQVVALGLGCAKNGELQGSADITLTDEAYQYLIQESAKTTSVTDMSVDDQMGDYIEFLEVVAGDYSTDPAVGPNNTLNWKVVPKSNPEPQKVSNTEFWQLNVAELLYKVRLDVTKADFNSCANKMNSSTSDDESYKVNNYATLKYNGSSEATFPVPYVRGLLYDLQFTKVAEVNGVEKTVTDVPALKNAVFKITDGTTTKTASPDDNGVVKFTGLPWGNYTVSETTVPSGYTKGNDFSANLCYTTNASNLTASALDNTHETLTSYSNAADNKVVNKKKKTTSIIVKKVGANSAVLAGAKFKLFRVDGTDVIVGEEFTVPKAGWTINGLTSGSYKLQETSAPDGYIIVSDPIEFTVNATGTGAVIQWPEGTGKPASVQELSGTDNDTITVINTPGQALPNTGGHGTLLYTLSGLMLIITSAIMFGFRRRLREGKCR